MKNCFLFLILCFQSLPVLSSSIEIDSVETRQIFENGRALLKAGYVDSSCIYFDQALERYLHLVESNPEDHIFKGYINAARAKVKFLEKKRLFEQAHEVLAQLLEFSILHLGEIHPYTAAVYNEIGVVYYLELDFNHAREYFEIALDVRVKALGEFSIDVANSYNNIGMVYDRNGDYDRALECYEKSLILYHNLGVDKGRLGSTLTNIGMIYESTGKYDLALDFYRQALEARQLSFGEIHEEPAICHVQMGNVYYAKGDFDQAELYYQNALDIFQKVPKDSRSSIAMVLNNFGIINHEKGQYDRALDFYNRSLAIKLDQLGPVHPHIANTYSNIANVFIMQGDENLALEYYKKALEIRLEIFGEDHPKVAGSYQKIGTIYRHTKDHERALFYLRKSMSIVRRTMGENHPDIAGTLVNISGVYLDQGDYEKALEAARQSYQINYSNHGENHPLIVENYRLIGDIYVAKGESEKGFEYLNKSLTLIGVLKERDHPDHARILTNIGDLYKKADNYMQAIHCYKKAEEIYVNKFGEFHPQVAAVRLCQAQVHLDQDLFDAALACTQTALATLDSSVAHRPMETCIQPDSTILTPMLWEALVLHAKILINGYESGFGDKRDQITALQMLITAAEVSDRLRNSYKSEEAKLFLNEKISQTHELAIRTAVDLYFSTQQIKYLEQSFWFAERAKADVLEFYLQESRAKRFTGIPDSLLALESSIKTELTYLETRLQKENEKGDERDTELCVRLEDALFKQEIAYQEMLADLERNYPRYYHLKYTRETSTFEQLQKELDEDTALLEYYYNEGPIYVFIVTGDQFDVVVLEKTESVIDLVDKMHKAIRTIDTFNFARISHELYRNLFTALEEKLSGKKRLICIPHGTLYKLSFEALLTEKAADRRNFSKLDYLIKQYTIDYHYSATLSQNSGHQIVSSTPSFLGIAPVFCDSLSSRQHLATRKADRVRGNDMNGYNFPQLEYSEQEVDQIADLYQKQGYPTLVLTHDNALKNRFIEQSGLFSHLHIATHGIFNAQYPRLSGIVFTPEDTLQDGILYAGEIYNLKLNADLVALSSCESGVGKLAKGEGILALTRGLLYAGANNIIVSLWKVPDKHTSGMFVNFYKYYLSGTSYSAALHAAKLDLIKNAATAFPKSWASFVLVGR